MGKQEREISEPMECHQEKKIKCVIRFDKYGGVTAPKH